MTGPEKIPDWMLERYRLGELAPERRSQVEQALARDPEVVARLSALATSDAEILQRYPPRVVRQRVEEVLRSERPRNRFLLPALSVLTVAAAVLLVLQLQPTDPQTDTDPQPDIGRIKGLRPQLEVFRKGQHEPLGEGALTREGDVLQLSFVRGEDTHGAIVSIDGRGAVTVHAANLPPTQGSGATLLKQALTLDDAPTFERYFLVTGDSPVPLDTLTAAALDLAQDPVRAQTEPLALPRAFHQTDRLLRKEDSP